jgi:hypothetical protein
MRTARELMLLVALVASPILLSIAIAQSATPMMMMKAVVIQEYGGPEVLKYDDVSQPERRPATGEGRLCQSC